MCALCATVGRADWTYDSSAGTLTDEDGWVKTVGTFSFPEKYAGEYWRCDLHGRFRPDGGQFGFNSVHEGSRQLYVMDVR